MTALNPDLEKIIKEEMAKANAATAETKAQQDSEIPPTEQVNSSVEAVDDANTETVSTESEGKETPQPVPYERFKEVNEIKTKLETELGLTKKEKEELENAFSNYAEVDRLLQKYPELGEQVKEKILEAAKLDKGEVVSPNVNSDNPESKEIAELRKQVQELQEFRQKSVSERELHEGKLFVDSAMLKVQKEVPIFADPTVSPKLVELLKAQWRGHIDSGNDGYQFNFVEAAKDISKWADTIFEARHKNYQESKLKQPKPPAKPDGTKVVSDEDKFKGLKPGTPEMVKAFASLLSK